MAINGWLSSCMIDCSVFSQRRHAEELDSFTIFKSEYVDPPPPPIITNQSMGMAIIFFYDLTLQRDLNNKCGYF